jgi:hypothetical protein
VESFLLVKSYNNKVCSTSGLVFYNLLGILSEHPIFFTSSPVASPLAFLLFFITIKVKVKLSLCFN